MLPKQVRVKFTKVGALQFISHLDLNRTMKNVMLRAKLPIRYSEGFNPHPKMVFALPLSIGAESVCELLDFKINEDIPYSEIKERLNLALPPEMRVLEAYNPQRKLTEIKFAEYEIKAEGEFDTSALECEKIVIMKRSKSGEKECDIKPLIHSWEKTEGGIKCILSASPEQYLNPEYIVSLLKLRDISITRTRTLLADGETEFK